MEKKRTLDVERFKASSLKKQLLKTMKVGAFSLGLAASVMGFTGCPNPNGPILEPEPEIEQPAEKEPEDTKPDDTKPDDTKPDDTKPDDATPDDGGNGGNETGDDNGGNTTGDDNGGNTTGDDNGGNTNGGNENGGNTTGDDNGGNTNTGDDNGNGGNTNTGNENGGNNSGNNGDDNGGNPGNNDEPTPNPVVTYDDPVPQQIGTSGYYLQNFVGDDPALLFGSDGNATDAVKHYGKLMETYFKTQADNLTDPNTYGDLIKAIRETNFENVTHYDFIYNELALALKPHMQYIVGNIPEGDRHDFAGCFYYLEDQNYSTALGRNCTSIKDGKIESDGSAEGNKYISRLNKAILYMNDYSHVQTLEKVTEFIDAKLTQVPNRNVNDLRIITNMSLALGAVEGTDDITKYKTGHNQSCGLPANMIFGAMQDVINGKVTVTTLNTTSGREM